jgi:hypothetical protein
MYVRVNQDRIASKVMDGEAIVIDLSTGNYYSLEGAAGMIWSAVQQGATVEQIANEAHRLFDVDAEHASADVTAFCASLVSEELAVATDASANPALTLDAPASPAQWVAPGFEKFTDMAEMFALDPPLPGVARQGG